MRKFVHLSPHQTTWSARFDEEAAAVQGAFGPSVLGAEHIGSTSVPGLIAKPTIDILVGVGSLELDREVLARMELLGYTFRGEAGVPGRRFFRKGSSFPRDFNVQVVIFEGEVWQRNIDFRDYLRAHPETAETYGVLKRELIASDGGAAFDRYAASKAGFIVAVCQRAEDWRANEVRHEPHSPASQETKE
jgi:GrpB-like predicted nucleotidyltransferase (UPF0157 family)